ncbi:MAG: hypothetical protein RR540_04640 [Oscillospiraceae bacterium]
MGQGLLERGFCRPNAEIPPEKGSERLIIIKKFSSMVKRGILLVIAIVTAFVFTACGQPEVDGDELIHTAKAEYKALESGKLTISDEDSGETQSEFVFKYDKKTLIFAFKSQKDEQDYFEYNDGKSMKFQVKGEVSEYKWPSKNFTKYTKKKPHPNASTGIFFFEPDCVSSAKVEETDGGKTVTYAYDIGKLSKKMAVETSDGKMTEFSTEYHFDSDGNFAELLEKSTFDSGKSHCYSIKISDRDSVLAVESPIK